MKFKSSAATNLLYKRVFKEDILLKLAEYSKNIKEMQNANEEIKKLYEEFFKEPNSPIAHKYLHTHYAEQFIYMPDVVDRV